MSIRCYAGANASWFVQGYWTMNVPLIEAPATPSAQYYRQLCLEVPYGEIASAPDNYISNPVFGFSCTEWGTSTWSWLNKQYTMLLDRLHEYPEDAEAWLSYNMGKGKWKYRYERDETGGVQAIPDGAWLPVLLSINYMRIVAIFVGVCPHPMDNLLYMPDYTMGGYLPWTDRHKTMYNYTEACFQEAKAQNTHLIDVYAARGGDAYFPYSRSLAAGKNVNLYVFREV